MVSELDKFGMVRLVRVRGFWKCKFYSILRRWPEGHFGHFTYFRALALILIVELVTCDVIYNM